MNHFQRKDGVLYAEDVAVEALAERHGTPLYVYSTATLARHWKVLHRSLSRRDLPGAPGPRQVARQLSRWEKALRERAR